MRGLVALVAASLACACATAPAIDQAVSIHNVFRQVVLDVDSAYAPVYTSVSQAAQTEFPQDDAGYTKTMLPYSVALSALTEAKHAEQVMHQAIEQAQAAAGGTVLASTIACSADAADKLAIAFGQVPSGSTLYGIAFAVSSQLRALAGDAKCEVQP